ncbi:MAG: hypothetical protein JNL05_05020 [Flavobacteriales bacterium]|nr:hypothetical protein [Flavobacteriales bacterium]
MVRSSSVTAFLLCSCAAFAQQYTISTIAGTGAPGSSGNGGQALSAELLYPAGLALDVDGSLYFTQGNDHVVRVVDTQGGTISHVAGTGTLGFGGNGGPAAVAGLAAPYDLAFDAAGNLYISEGDAYRIRRIDAVDGTIGTFAGTTGPGNNTEVPALAADLNGPRGIAFNVQGELFISMVGNDCVRYIDADSSHLHAFAGTGNNGSAGFSGDGGAAHVAQLYSPYGIAVAPNGNVHIADLNNRRIRMVDVSTGIITTIAGSGLIPYDGDGIPATTAAIGRPQWMAFDAAGHLYFSSPEQNRIRRVDAVTGIISTIAGTGLAGFGGDNGPATDAEINNPADLVIAPDGRIFFADSYNHRIRLLTPVDDTSVNALAIAELSVHPTPATDVLQVRSVARGIVDLCDMQGRTVKRITKKSDLVCIPLDDLGPGIYLVRLEGAVPVRVVVE